jgi:hypothetical protein
VRVLIKIRFLMFAADLESVGTGTHPEMKPPFPLSYYFHSRRGRERNPIFGYG